MNLHFEDWVRQQKFSVRINRLFAESFISYKNGAYRASLLFGYIGFLTAVKERILKSAKPAGIDAGRWSNIITQLQNDDQWEKRVFDEISNSSNPIFNITEDIRMQVKYWKDRRNDCAHAKDNDIAAHHSESFWSFLKSNLAKITVEGGKAALINKFVQHFDFSLTPPNSDFSHLVQEIDTAVPKIDLAGFWTELTAKIDGHGFVYGHTTPIKKVVNRVFDLCDESTIESVVQFLKSNKLDLKIVSLYPHRVNIMGYSAAEVRQIWTTRMWNDKSVVFSVYSALLRNDLIPAQEIKEANNLVINTVTDDCPFDESEHIPLAKHGFGDSIYKIAFVDGKINDVFDWTNNKVDLLGYYVAIYPLQDLTVKTICEMYTKHKYSWGFAARLETMFEQNPTKKQEFHDIANAKGYTIPEQLN